MKHIRFCLSEEQRKFTALGYDYVEPVSYGYDSTGDLASMVCKVWSKGEKPNLMTLTGMDIHEDLMMFYDVEDRPVRIEISEVVNIGRA